MEKNLTGAELIAQERQRQIDVEGFDDDQWRTDESLAMAAAAYATPSKSRDLVSFYGDSIPKNWPFKSKWWKPTPGDRIKELTKAGALIAAEIDRLQALNPTTDAR